MSKTVRTDYEEVKPLMDRISSDVTDLLDGLQKLGSVVQDMATEGGIKDQTIDAVSNKLDEINQNLSPATEILDSLNATLRAKSDELAELVGDSVRSVDNI